MTTLSIDPFPSLDDLPLPSLVRSDQHDALVGLRRQAEAEGRRAGYDDGRSEGLAHGAAHATAELAGRLDQLAVSLRDTLGAVEEAWRQQADDQARAVTELVLSIAELVVGRELELANSPGRDAIVRALAAAPDRGDVTARLNPADLDVLGDIAHVGAGRNITVIGDPTVSPGGCVLDVGGSRIDACLDTAMERVRAVLLGSHEAPPESLA